MKPTITYAEFDQLELRVGKVLTATAPDWSHKLMELTVDFGPEIGQRTILSGIRAWYEPAELIGQIFPFLINLAERKMGEGVSQGMMLMADQGETAVILPLSDQLQPGAIIR